jgi:hypothetical protein
MNQWIDHVAGATSALRCAMGEVDAQGCARPERAFSRRAVEALRVVLPYCLAPVDACTRAGTDTLIWLNRDYKPLGCPDTGFYRYEEHTHVQVNAAHPAVAVVHRRAVYHEHPVYVLDRGPGRQLRDRPAPRWWCGMQGVRS